jgi:hypothetical protein
MNKHPSSKSLKNSHVWKNWVPFILIVAMAVEVGLVLLILVPPSSDLWDSLREKNPPGFYVAYPHLEKEPQAERGEAYISIPVIITGLVERDQEPRAREMAAKYKDKKMIPYFDDKLGWVLITDSANQPVFRTDGHVNRPF